MSDALAEVRATDRSNQLDDVFALPDHLSDALWRVESAKLDPFDAAGGLVVCGMGGSAIGGDLAAVAFGNRLSRPLTTERGYELPSCMLPDRAVLCSSYSGDTEETLACYEAAGALGAARVVSTTGGLLAEAARADGVPVIGVPAGLLPRSAVGYMIVSTLEVAAIAGAAPRMRTEIDGASAYLAELARDWAPDVEASLPKQIAEQAHGSALCVYGAGPTAAVAHRWKTQVNENAKLPAFAGELPEVDHNEIVGWAGAGTTGSFFAIFLEDSDQHPRTRRRIELTSSLIEPHSAGSIRVESRGKTPLERLLYLVLLGDLVSIYLAVLQGVDPTPVEVIDRLKLELGRPEFD